MHSFTQEDLLQYMYSETSNEKTAAIKVALETDWNLREQYEVLTQARQSLEKVTLSPRQKAIDFILDYAGEQTKKLTHQVG